MNKTEEIMKAQGEDGNEILKDQYLAFLAPNGHISKVTPTSEKWNFYNADEKFQDISFESFEEAVAYATEKGFDVEIGKDGYNVERASLTHRATERLKKIIDEDIKKKIKSDVFVRYGDLPKNGKSKNFADDRYEKGVSVFKGQLLDDGSVIVTPGHNQELGTKLTMDDRPLYIVAGNVVGYGSDGEPLLGNAKIVKTVKEYEVKLI